MITAAFGARLRLVLQVDHAAVAADLAAAWGGRLFSPAEPRGAVKLAAQIHDQGWADWDQQPRIHPENRRPYHFMNMPSDEHITIYERCVRIAAEHHPYVGLLVSLHGAGLYKQRYGHMPNLEYRDVLPEYRECVERFLGEQQNLQDDLIRDLQIDSTTVWTHYRWLQAWDAMSVFMCLSDPAQRRSFDLGTKPLRPGGPEERLVIAGAGPGTFTVDPWPFGLRWLEVFLPVRYVPDQAYENDEAFQAIFEAAPTESVALILRPARDLA